MKASVIISAYKDRGWLEKAIRSAKNQNFDDYEIILSSDGNPELETFAKEYNLKFILTPKGNHCTALNNAVSFASGEWIKELHDDDTLSLDCLKNLWDARSDYDMIHANAFDFASGLSIWSRIYKPPPDIKILNLMPVITNPIHAATIFFKRDVFLNLGGFDPQIDCSEEYEFYINFFKHGYRLGYCDSIVASYRYHSDSETGNNTTEKRFKIQQYIINKHRQYLSEL